MGPSSKGPRIALVLAPVPDAARRRALDRRSRRDASSVTPPPCLRLPEALSDALAPNWSQYKLAGREASGTVRFPCVATGRSYEFSLATMWTWVARDRAEGDRVLAEILAPLLDRVPDELRGQVCVGPAEHCAELLSRYAEAGCQRVYLWPLGDERRQIELVAREVVPELVSR